MNSYTEEVEGMKLSERQLYRCLIINNLMLLPANLINIRISIFIKAIRYSSSPFTESGIVYKVDDNIDLFQNLALSDSDSISLNK